jgi:NADH-quinone oxidoreductase subunit L
LAHPSENIGIFILLAALSVGAGLAGAAAAFLAYNRPAQLWEKFENSFGKIWGWWQKGYGVDDAYGAAVVVPGRKLAESAAFRFDLGVVDGLVNGVGKAVRGLAARLRPIQNGLVRSYGLLFAAGVVAVVTWMLARGA